jgi:hypothetical protein
MKLRYSAILLTLFSLGSSVVHAESMAISSNDSVRPTTTKKQKIWRISAAVLGAITIADIQSSYGRREMNPLLQSQNGRFGSRGIAVKSALVGGGLTAQWLLLRKHPEASGYAAAVNFAATAATGAVVVRNHSQ